jgi:copper chaperone CopZ
MPVSQEILQVSGIRCERCVQRLSSALRGMDGLEAATANLMGQITLTYDDSQVSREQLVEALSRAGFHELQSV